MSDYPIVSSDPAVQKHYVLCRKEGTSHNLAEMYAFGQPPMSKTDREFLEGHHNGNQFEGAEWVGDHYKAIAESEGQCVKGKIYLNGLAAYPGDPRAWVTGRGDVQKVCEERGWDCEGMVDVKARRQPEKERLPMPVGEDIVAAKVESICAELPDGHMVDRADLTEQVREKLAPSWKTEARDG